MGEAMKRWTISTMSTVSHYNTYSILAETKGEALERYDKGEADFIDSNEEEVLNESFDRIEMVEDLVPEDMKMDDGL
jgi:hypothetical protein